VYLFARSRRGHPGELISNIKSVEIHLTEVIPSCLHALEQLALRGFEFLVAQFGKSTDLVANVFFSLALGASPLEDASNL